MLAQLLLDENSKSIIRQPFVTGREFGITRNSLIGTRGNLVPKISQLDRNRKQA